MAALPIVYQRDALPDDVHQLKDIIVTLSTHLESLHQQILNLRRLHFGATSEQIAGQAALFTETVTLPTPPTSTETITYTRPRLGRPALPKDLPRRRIEYDLSDAEKAAFDHIKKIGEEVSETLDYTPAQLTVIVHARAKYVCEKDGESTIRVADAQPSPLPKSNASAGLIAHVLTSKYADHQPLHRLEKICKRHGIPIPKSTLCEWALAGAGLLEVLIAPLRAHVLGAPRLHCDDTVLALLEPKRGKTRTARLWGYLGAGMVQTATGEWIDYAPAVIFDFTTTHEAIHPMNFLNGYRGYLQADAYNGFDRLYASGDIIEVGCLAHSRRKFYEVANTQKKPGLAHEALAFIGKLYQIESRIKDRPPDEKKAVRQSEAIPVWDDFKIWCESHYPKVLPKSPLGRAFRYALNNWQALMRYTENGILEIDNNRLERALRPIAMGRSLCTSF